MPAKESVGSLDAVGHGKFYYIGGWPPTAPPSRGITQKKWPRDTNITNK